MALRATQQNWRRRPKNHWKGATRRVMPTLPESDAIAELLKRAKTIAVVGLSDNPFRASHGVSAYMQSQGYHIIPVNPHIRSRLGEKAYASLLDLPEQVHIENLFRRSEVLE